MEDILLYMSPSYNFLASTSEQSNTPQRDFVLQVLSTTSDGLCLRILTFARSDLNFFFLATALTSPMHHVN